jgi:hypothetical protein
MASDALMAAGVAIDALFAFIDSDKLKLADLFTRIDKDRSGTLEREELEMCLTSAFLESLLSLAAFACLAARRWLLLPKGYPSPRRWIVQCWASAWNRHTWTQSWRSWTRMATATS